MHPFKFAVSALYLRISGPYGFSLDVEAQCRPLIRKLPETLMRDSEPGLAEFKGLGFRV